MSPPSSSLRIEELGLIRDGQRVHIAAPSEPTSIRVTFRMNRTSARQDATLDFTADVTARSRLGDSQHWPLGTVRGAVRVDEPLSVELAGPPLPRGLHRLEATVLIYPADHAPDSEPLQSRRTSGALIQVA